MSDDRPIITTSSTRMSAEAIEWMLEQARKEPALALDVIGALCAAIGFSPEADWDFSADVDFMTVDLSDRRLHPWVPGAFIKPVMASLQRLKTAA